MILVSTTMTYHTIATYKYVNIASFEWSIKSSIYTIPAASCCLGKTLCLLSHVKAKNIFKIGWCNLRVSPATYFKSDDAIYACHPQHILNRMMQSTRVTRNIFSLELILFFSLISVKKLLVIGMYNTISSCWVDVHVYIYTYLYRMKLPHIYIYIIQIIHIFILWYLLIINHM